MVNKKFFYLPKVNFYLWIIFSLIIIIVLLNIIAAIPAVILLACLLYYNLKSNKLRKKEIIKYVENLTFNIDTATKDTLLNFPLPLVVLELDGKILWYNSLFRKIFDGEDLLEETISAFSKELHPQNFDIDSVSFSKHIEIDGKYYNVLGNYAKVDIRFSHEGFILFLYLIETTELIETKKIYAQEKSVIGVIVIDNYDDLMQSMEDNKRPQMLAEIDKQIIEWMSFTKGIIKKFERDKYLFVFENKHLKELETKKFEVLDMVREINIGNKIPVTLSIGLGMNGDSLIANFQSAIASIDIALGRGGDQVVIKNGENISFFGGVAKELEKRTKVKARVISFALCGLIDQSEDVMIMGHENCDIDCLGASLGLYRIAKIRGKNANIVLNKVTPTIERLVLKLSEDNEYTDLFIDRNAAINRISEKTLLIVVDTHKPVLTECPELLKHTRQIVVIDHHRRAADYIQDAVLTYQETYASSACELVAEILQYVEEKIQLKTLEAEALYAGIIIDTKKFTFKTGVRTFEAAAFLKRQGIDPVSVGQIFQQTMSTYVMISEIVKNSEIINDGIAISQCPQNIKNTQLLAAQAADQILSLSGIMAAFVLAFEGDEVYISGRSLGDINVQVILEKLGGGGHYSVAGAKLGDVSLNEARQKLKDVIFEYIEGLNKET